MVAGPVDSRSRPVIVSAGRRDFGEDAGVPTVIKRAVRAAPSDAVSATGIGRRASAISTRTCAVPARARRAVGDLVALSPSHPCTTFDKWRVIHVSTTTTACSSRWRPTSKWRRSTSWTRRRCVVDLDAFEAQLRACFVAPVRRRGAAAQKTREVPRGRALSCEAGARGICVAKLSEAEVMLDAGLDDVLITTELAGPDQGGRLGRTLARHPERARAGRGRFGRRRGGARCGARRARSRR